MRLGVVASETQIDALCERINQIMLGDIRYERMQMQLCPSASDDREMVDFSQNHKGSSLKYRKIQELEMDPLFLDYIQNPLFRDITQKKIGDRVSVFRAMFFNKPAEGGISKNWHQDSGWDLSIPEEITVYTALDPQTRENGCLMVIPIRTRSARSSRSTRTRRYGSTRHRKGGLSWRWRRARSSFSKTNCCTPH